MSTSTSVSWIQCSAQPINLTPFAPPINVTIDPNVDGLPPQEIAVGASQPVLVYIVPPNIPAGAFITLEISDTTRDLRWSAITITSDGESSQDSDGSCDVHPTPAGGATVGDDGNSIEWPQCSTQTFDLTAYTLPVNVSVSAGGDLSRVATNVNARVYPIRVAYDTGVQATVYIDDSAGIHHEYSHIDVVDGTDSSCLTEASSTTSSTASTCTSTPLSPSSAASTPSATSSSLASQHSSPTAAIAGGAAGGGAAIAILLSILLFCWWKRRERRRTHAMEIDPAFGAEAGDNDVGDLPSYTDVVSPTPLTMSVSDSGRSPTPYEETLTSSDPRLIRREKSPTQSYSAYPRHSRGDSSTVLLSPASPTPTLVLRAQNPDFATTLDTPRNLS
ncbi:unnamed protein product [Peniophora sp. CBMAI 1063]|nr:unnamed protein product [Peniophora sp. CBMAI 1063]